MDRITFKSLFTLIICSFVFGCAKKEQITESLASKMLYFSTGQCNSGAGITTFTGTTSSRMISKVDLTTGASSVILDLSAPYQGGVFAPETASQSLVDNGTSLLLLTENAVNTGDRKVFSIPKLSPFNTTIFASDALALTPTAAHIARTMVKDVDGALLFSKSVSTEKIGTNSLRIPVGANSWVNAPAGTCATSTTFMSALQVLPPLTGATSGKIIYAHQGATAISNRL
ncbi:MAG: hypothetical protein WA160_12220, partial [Pseudobdellovibrio sp.]